MGREKRKEKGTRWKRKKGKDGEGKDRGKGEMGVIDRIGVASNRQEKAIASSWNLPNKKRPG